MVLMGVLTAAKTCFGISGTNSKGRMNLNDAIGTMTCVGVVWIFSDLSVFTFSIGEWHVLCTPNKRVSTKQMESIAAEIFK